MRICLKAIGLIKITGDSDCVIKLKKEIENSNPLALHTCDAVMVIELDKKNRRDFHSETIGGEFE